MRWPISGRDPATNPTRNPAAIGTGGTNMGAGRAGVRRGSGDAGGRGGLSDTFGGYATPAALETEFNRGFTAGEREAAATAEQDARFAETLAAADSAGYSRGLRQGLTEATTVFVPKFAVSAGQDAEVVFTIYRRLSSR